MKITIFNGTPRLKGNTAAMTEVLTEELRRCGADVDEVFLDGLDIKGCSNCKACEEKQLPGFCTVKDGMIPLYDRFRSCDVMIVASPIYMWSLTAPTIAFLTRLHAVCKHDGPRADAIKGKKVALAMTMGDEEFVASYAVASLMDFCEYFGMPYSGAIAVPFADRDAPNEPANRERIRRFAERLTS